MPRRNWKGFHPRSLTEAVDGCIDFAMERHRRDMQRIADLMGTTRWTLYKWVGSGGIPVRLIAAFEHACGCHFVTAYLAASARRLLIDFPTGRVPGDSDVHAVQEACTAAVGSLLAFARQELSQEDTLGSLTRAMELLGHQHANVAHHQQPELDLDGRR